LSIPKGILADDITNAGRDETLIGNLLAASMLSDAIKTSFGPCGLEKMYIDIMGESIITKDGGTFLRKIDVEHPSAKVVIDGANTVDNSVGDGTKSSVILVGSLAKNAIELIKLGISPAVIITGYQRATELSLETLNEISETRNLEKGIFFDLVRTALSSKSMSSLVDDSENLSKIIVDAVCSICDLKTNYIEVDDIKIEESPKWLQHKLKAIGLAPINNVVDITNYILHGLGQPLHAFDASKIKGNKVLVKNLPTGTKFTTLDGVVRELHEDDIMICDGESNPMCIAGVFGGEKSGVTNNTTSIFLESAYFNPVSIRKTAKRHALNTDASFRFERGINPETAVYALKRAAIWIKDIAGGKIVSEITDIYPDKIEDFQVHISYDHVYRLIGEEIPTDTIKNILASLDIKINNQTASGLGLTIPSYRVDVTREADIVEEILRVYGYNNIEIPQKINTSIASSNHLSPEKIENIVANYLVANGLKETMANSLTKPEYVNSSESLQAVQNVSMLNALSNDLSVMRQSMLFGNLEAVAYNINRKNNRLKFFEFGNTYHKYESGYDEKKHLSIIISGDKNKDNWKVANSSLNIFYLKGIIISLLERLGISKLKHTIVKNDIYSEAIGLSLGKTKLVEFGIVKSDILNDFSIRQEVLFADFNWNNVLENTGKKEIKVKPLPKYPEVKRDLALLIDDEVKFMELYNAAFQCEKKLLKEVDLFDVYTGDKLPKGKKSYALSFVLQDENKTLNDKQIDKIMKKLQETFAKQFGAELR